MNSTLADFTVKNSFLISLLTFLLFSNSGFSQTLNSTADTSFVADSVGYLIVNFTNTKIDSFYLVINENFNEPRQLANNEMVPIKTGKSKIRIIKKYYRDVVANLEVKADSIIRYSTNIIQFRNFSSMKYFSSYPRLFWKVPGIIMAESDAQLYVDEKYIGTGIGGIDSTGKIKVKSVLPSGETRTKALNLNSEKSAFVVRKFYQRPEMVKSRFLAILPGFSQIYQKERRKGFALLAAVSIGIGFTTKYHSDYKDKYELFEQTRKYYNSATNPDRVFKLGNLAEKQLNEATQSANLRDIFLYGTIGIYLYNLIDAIIKPPKIGYRNKIKFDPYLEFDRSYRQKIGLNAKYSF